VVKCGVKTGHQIKSQDKQATALWLHLNNLNTKGFKWSQAWKLTRLLQQLENSRACQDKENTDLKTDQ
jgi:flagellar basal body rod protein FlgG